MRPAPFVAIVTLLLANAPALGTTHSPTFSLAWDSDSADVTGASWVVVRVSAPASGETFLRYTAIVEAEPGDREAALFEFQLDSAKNLIHGGGYARAWSGHVVRADVRSDPATLEDARDVLVLGAPGAHGLHTWGAWTAPPGVSYAVVVASSAHTGFAFTLEGPSGAAITGVHAAPSGSTVVEIREFSSVANAGVSGGPHLRAVVRGEHAVDSTSDFVGIFAPGTYLAPGVVSWEGPGGRGGRVVAAPGGAWFAVNGPAGPYRFAIEAQASAMVLFGDGILAYASVTYPS